MLTCMMCGSATDHAPDFIFKRPQGVPYWLLMRFRTPFFYEKNGIIIEGRTGDFLLHAPNTPLVHGPAAAFDGGFCNDWIYFEGDEAADIVEELSIPINYAFSLQTPSSFMPLLEQIVRESTERAACYSYKVCGALYMLLSDIGRARREISDKRSPSASAIKNVHDIIMREFGSQWTLTDMAGLSGYSVSRFCALYKRAYGISPVDDLIKYRINKARYILLSGENNVSETAAICGFSSLHYFSSAFKRFTGRSPSSFMAQDRLLKDGEYNA